MCCATPILSLPTLGLSCHPPNPQAPHLWLDTVEVAVFDPQEVDPAMAQQWGQSALFLPLHEQRHKVLYLAHGNIALVVSTDQGLRVGREGPVITGTQGPSTHRVPGLGPTSWA